MTSSADSTRRSVQRQARALGDPTRYRIFRLVAESPAPVRVAALTEQIGINHSAVRQHLAKLCDAGLLVEEFAPGGSPGRPPLEYRLSPDAAGSWDTSGPYEALSLMLLEVLLDGGSPRAVGARAVRTSLASGAAKDALDALEREMARRGFRPRPVQGDATLEVVLDNCPFPAAAAAAPEIVCELHRGLADGVLDHPSSTLQVSELVAHNPDLAGCRIRLEPRSTGEAERVSPPPAT